jgi:hypothetical protein
MRPNVKPGTPRCPAKLVEVCLVGVAMVGEAVVLNCVVALTTVTLVRVVGVWVLDGASEVELAVAVVLYPEFRISVALLNDVIESQNNVL